MFNVLLDNPDNSSEQQKRLRSCILFVADKCTPVGLYLNTAWHEKELFKELGYDLSNLNTKQKDVLRSHGFNLKDYDPKMPKVVYMTLNDWAQHKSDNNSLPIKIPKNEFVLSQSEYVNKAILEDQGFNSTTAILCLAACGIDILLPNISMNLIAEEEIHRIKEILQEDRIAYLDALTKIADESYERIKSGELSDILRWAQNEFYFKLTPKVRIIEQDASKIPRNELTKAGFSFWKDSVPIIGKSFFEKGVGAASITAAEELLKLILSVLNKDYEKRSLPEVAYALRLSDHLNYKF